MLMVDVNTYLLNSAVRDRKQNQPSPLTLHVTCLLGSKTYLHFLAVLDYQYLNADFITRGDKKGLSPCCTTIAYKRLLALHKLPFTPLHHLFTHF